MGSSGIKAPRELPNRRDDDADGWQFKSNSQFTKVAVFRHQDALFGGCPCKNGLVVGAWANFAGPNHIVRCMPEMLNDLTRQALIDKKPHAGLLRSQNTPACNKVSSEGLSSVYVIQIGRAHV